MKKTLSKCLGIAAAVLLLVLALAPLAASQPTWNIETVDSTGDVGGYTSIALDSNGYPHISYYNDTLANIGLKYAKWTGSTWSIETVDSIGNVGVDTSIALDTNDYPHISYYDSTNSDLKYAKWTGSTWSMEPVDSTGNVGWHTSIALDTNDHPHISYHDMTNSDLKYAKWTGSTWSIEPVDSTWNVGGHTSIALDSDDHPHISYYDSTKMDLKYAKWTGSTWSIETVDSIGNVGGHTSITLDSDDHPHISYYDNTNIDLKYAKWTGSTWSIQTVDSAGYVGTYTSIALDTNDYPHISYHDMTNIDLKYAKWTGSTWSIQTVDLAGYVGGYTSIALDIDDYPHISYNYNDGTNNNLKYANLAGPADVDAVLSTTLSDRYTAGEPVVVGVSVENTGTSPFVGIIEVTTTSGFSDTKTVTVPAAPSIYSESFNIGSFSGGSYIATVNLSIDSSFLLDSRSKSFTVQDPAAVKIVDDNAESLKITAIDEFDEMAGIPASASSGMIADVGFNKLQKYIGDHFTTATGEVQKESSGSISDSDVQSMSEEANGTIDSIKSGISGEVSRLIIQRVNEATDENLPEYINIFELKESVTEEVYGRIKDAFEDIFTGVLKDHVLKPLLTDSEENKVVQRDGEFNSYVDSTPFSLTNNEETRIRQRFNAGCGSISSVTESKALFTIGPYSIPLVGEFSYSVTLREEKNKFDQITQLGGLIKYAIGALAVIGVVFTFIVTVLATGGAFLLPLITAIPHIITFLTSVVNTIIPIAKTFLIVGMLATVSLIAPEVTLQHDTTLDTIEDIIADITTSQTYSVSISMLSPTASYINQPSLVTLLLDNNEPAHVQPITEVMVFSPDGRIIDIQRQDPYIAPHSFTGITQRLHLPSQSGTYTVLGMIHAGGVATSIAQERMTVTKPSLDINLSTDSLVYSINDTIEISANFTNNEASEIGNLTYIIEVINTSTVDANMMILAASSSQTKTVSFTPTEEGSYVAAATLLLGFSEMASETIGFTVGSGEGLVINTVAEDLYPPEADVTLPVTIENIGTVQTVSTVNITTFDELVDFSALYTDEIGVSLDAGATTTMQLCVLPNAPPGIYQTILTAGNFSAQSVSYTVTANGTLFTILDTDKLYYNLSDSVHINITTNDVLFNATNASVNVTVTCPNGTAAYLAVSGSDGNYTATFDPASNGTYQITATSQKIGFRTYDDETFVIVGIRSTLNANLPMNNLTFNQTVYFECNITNEYDVPIDNTITTLTGCGINTTTLSDGAGTVNFVITPNATGMVTLTAEKGGFADYTSKIYVLNITQSKIIYPDFTDTDTPGNWRTWIGVMNTGDASTTLNLTIYNQDGSLAYSNPNFVTLEPKAAHFFRPGITAGIAQGSTIVYGDNLAGTCHESKNDGDGAKVYTAVTSSSPTLYYPDFTDTDTIGNWRTWLGVVNAGDTSTTVRLDVYNPDGSLAYSNANFVTLEPKAAHFFRPGITAGIAQGCVVVSGANLAGTCHVNKNGGEGTKVYTALTSGSSTLYYPDFTDTDTIGNWRTWMGVMNTGDASTTLNLTIYNPDGSLAYFDANFITLEPKAAHFFRPGITAGRAQGDVVVYGDNLAGTCHVNKNGGEGTKVYTAMSSGSSTLNYPDFTDTDTAGNWRTWMGVMNTGATRTTVRLDVYNADGSLAYSNANFVTLEPKAAHFFRPGITAGIAQGDVVVSGDNLAGTCHVNKNGGVGTKVYTAVGG